MQVEQRVEKGERTADRAPEWAIEAQELEKSYPKGVEALERRINQLLKSFGLAEAADRIARGYSGGMQRRLDIAMALVHDPQVLFLDEPTTGLDPEIRADMWQEIGRLAHEHRKTVLLTTHYLEEADQLAARIAIV